jgi:hypothetical protein
MAQAMEQLPQVREELRDTQDRLNAALATVQRLELKLMDRAADIDTLNLTIRNLEVSRDDAELRFLEAEDRTEKALAFVRSTFGNAGQLLQALEPVKAEGPKVQSEGDFTSTTTFQTDVSADTQQPNVAHTEASASTGQSEVPPSDTVSQGTQWTSAPATGEQTASAPSSDGETSTGQREPDSIAASVDGNSQMQSSGNSTVSEEVAKPEPGKYAGKRYYDHDFYVPLSAWLAGGGTEADYHWRPSGNAVA